MKRGYLILLIIINWACSAPERNEAAESFDHNPTNNQLKLKYAQGFSVKYNHGATYVEVPKPYQGAKQGFKYLLVEKGEEIPTHEEDVQVIEIPIKSIVCTSTTHIPLLDYLGETDALVGFPTTDYISSEKMRKRIDNGAVTDLGVDKELNLELLTNLNPDLVMAYTMSSDLGQFRQIESAGIPVVINAEYIEPHPLGRAEWIKFMALFFNKEHEADSIFSSIEKKYLSLKSKADSIQQHPTVMSGIVYGDTWFMPGGNNYAAKILKDAGGNYLWSDDLSSGYLERSFEAVYDKAFDADYWIGVGSYGSLDALKSADQRYAQFKPFKEDHVYTYDKRKGAKGGSEFLELGYLRPDLILSDLIKILHPGKLENDSLYFHGKLRQKS